MFGKGRERHLTQRTQSEKQLWGTLLHIFNLILWGWSRLRDRLQNESEEERTSNSEQQKWMLVRILILATENTVHCLCLSSGILWSSSQRDQSHLRQINEILKIKDVFFPPTQQRPAALSCVNHWLQYRTSVSALSLCPPFTVVAWLTLAHHGPPTESFSLCESIIDNTKHSAAPCHWRLTSWYFFLYSESLIAFCLP